MTKYTSHDDLGSVEEQIAPRYLLNTTLFGHRIKLSLGRERWTSPRKHRIAIVTIHHESAWARRVSKGVISGLSNALAPDQLPTIDMFSADARDDMMQENVYQRLEEHRHEYAAVVTVGSWISVRVREYLRHQKWTIPHVFLGVHDPVGAGLIRSREYASRHRVGVFSAVLDYGRYVKLLKILRPTLKTVLLPFDPNFLYPGFAEEKQRLLYHLERSGIQLKTCEVDLHGNVAEQIKSHLNGVDVVWSLHEEATQIHAKHIARMCDKAGVTFCASDLACVFQGAAIGFGDSGTLLGAYGGQLCFALCSGQAKNHAIKSLELPHPAAMRVNPNFMHHQGIELDKKSAAFIQDIVPLGWE